jgi:hypothetical protein
MATCTSTAGGGNWNDSTKWSTGTVPTTGDSVVISSGNPITVNVNTATIANLTINSGATLAEDGNGRTITLTGDWTNNGGTFTPNTGTVTFSNTGANQNINGTASTQTFNALTVDKTSKTLAVNGTTATLTLNGTLTMTSGTFTPPATTNLAGVILNGGNYIAGANTNVSGDWTNSGGAVGGSAGNLIGSTSNNGSFSPPTDQLYMARFQATATGTLNSLKVFTAVAAHKCKLAIYSESNSLPSTLLAATGEITTVFGWNTGSISNVTITSGTYYWIAIAADANFNYQNQSTGGTYRNKSITYSGFNFPDPAGSLPNSGNNNLELVGYGLNITTGTILFNSNLVDQNINGTAATQIFNNITLGDTDHSVSVGSTGNTTNLFINGTLTVNANTTLNPAAGVIISGAGATGLTGSGTVQVTRTAATPDFASQYTIANKTYTNLTVDYAGSAAQTVSNVAYGNLKISNTVGATLAGNTTISGNLTIATNGILNLSTYTGSTANQLYFNTALQSTGTWGSTASAATNKNNTYFTAASTGYITIGSTSAPTIQGISTIQGINTILF